MTFTSGRRRIGVATAESARVVLPRSPITSMLWLAVAVGGIGLLMAIAFQVVAGVQYRIAEDAGREPGYSPDWIVAGTDVGLWLLLGGVLLLLASGVLAAVSRLRTTVTGAGESVTTRESDAPNP